jgi:hypothetical protein
LCGTAATADGLQVVSLSLSLSRSDRDQLTEGPLTITRASTRGGTTHPHPDSPKGNSSQTPQKFRQKIQNQSPTNTPTTQAVTRANKVPTMIATPRGKSVISVQVT